MYLLDTNHCSAAILGDENLLRRIAEVENSLITTCVIVQGELVDMAERSQRKEENLALIHHFIQGIYIYNIDASTATIYGQLKAALFNQFAPKDKNKRRKTKVTSKFQQPVIETITPDEFPPGETTTVEITGKNLDKIEDITVTDDPLIKVIIDSKKPERIFGQVDINPDHPPTKLNDFRVKTTTGTYNISPRQPATVSTILEIPEYPEIQGFKQAVEIILAGKHGTPKYFLYWLAQQRRRQFRVEGSDLLDQFVYQNTLFEHQKSGAQHCLRVMQDFGVAVSPDADGLGSNAIW